MGKRGRGKGKKLKKQSSSSSNNNNGGLSEELINNHNNFDNSDYEDYNDSESQYSESIVSQTNNNNNDEDDNNITGDMTPTLNDQLELLQQKREMTRVKAYKKVAEIMRKSNCAEWVDSNRDELLMIIMNSIKRGKEKEAIIAASVFSLVCLALGPEEESLYEENAPGIENIALKSRKPAICAAALRALTFSTFINTMEHTHTWHCFDILYTRIASASINSKKNNGNEIILEAACDCFGLLASTIQRQYFSGDNFQKTVSRLGALLQHDSSKVRIAAGQTLAMVFEINGESNLNENEKQKNSGAPVKMKQRGFSIHSVDGKNNTESFDGEDALKQAIQEEESLSVDEVVGMVEGLASEYDRSKGKKERKEQRSVFRNIVSSISNNENPELCIKIRNESITFEKWSHILQMNFLKSVLKSGFQFHFRYNPLVREIFGLGAPPEEDGTDKLSKLEKRMYMSDASSVKKERALERTKERRHKRNQKNQFMNDNVE